LPTLNEAMEALNRLLHETLAHEASEGIVLSGGIDSSLLAYHVSKIKPITGITMVLDSTEAPDRRFSKIVAERLGIKHILKTFTVEEATTAARDIVRIMKTFDHIEIRNGITVYLAIERSREEGLTCTITGDGGDELFAGYDYMVRMGSQELYAYIANLTKKWTFSAPIWVGLWELR